jgi:hypothetical protein
MFALLPLLLFQSSVGRASEKLFVRLDYRTDAALDGCPDEGTFRAMVSDQLGYDPFRADAPLKVVARTRADDTGIRGSIEWYDAAGRPRGERELVSRDAACAAHARTLSFAVAVQIQLLAREVEEAATEAPRSTVTPVAPTPPPGHSEAPSAARAQQARRSEPAQLETRTPWRFGLGAGPFVALGSSPRVTPGARVFAAAERGWFALDVGAEATLPASYSMTESAGFDQHVALGGLAGCAVVRPWSACFVNKLGRVHVRGYGVDRPRDASGLVALSGARLALGHEFSRTWLAALRLEAVAALGSWDVNLSERTVWTTPPVSVFLGIDVAMLFE